MARRVIGIDVGPAHIHAAQMLRTRQGLSVERAATHALPDHAPSDPGVGEMRAQALRALMQEEGFRTDVPVAAAMPYGDVLYASLVTDLRQMDHVRRVMRFELEDDVPLSVDDAVMDICAVRDVSADSKSLLIGATSRAALQKTVDTFCGGDMGCDTVGSQACAFFAVAARSVPSMAGGPSIAAYATRSRVILAAGEGGRLLAARDLTHVRLDRDTPQGSGVSRDHHRRFPRHGRCA